MKFKTIEELSHVTALRDVRHRGGFIAVIAVILLATGTLAFSLVTMSTAIAFAENVSKRELRIQTRMNARACLDTVKLSVAKNYFLAGNISMSKFGCEANITNDFAGNIFISVEVKLSEVSILGKSSLTITNSSIIVNSEDIF